ncbi:hypothetical protein ACIRF8_14310 [Streptomyces sp. NPDC102406]|uniref:hypothetical protein n=1 Tax=Streptomyces sp. NPDC102406 TaxID=3366171 RepID=UPI0037F67449
MNDPQGIPAAPSDRDLPNQRRTREELLMKIGAQDNEASLRRRWGVPLGVATSVTAVSVAAVVVLGGTGEAGPSAAGPGHRGAGPAHSTAAPSPSASQGSGTAPSSARGASPETDFTLDDATTTPIDAGTVPAILSSCLGSGASQYRAVLAARTPIASADHDGVVVAVDSAGQYVQCQSKGDKGTSQDSPPTFINDRLWGTGHVIAYFDSMLEPAGDGRYVALGAGHYASGVDKITISYGDDPKEYPARMADGAFVYGAALTPKSPAGPRYMGPSPYVHAYDASGKQIYDQTKDPKFTGDQ